MKDEKYPHIVYIERETTDDFHNKASSIAGDQTTDIEGLSNFLTLIRKYILSI